MLRCALVDSRLDGGEISNWKIPKTTDRVIFLEKMRSLANPRNLESIEIDQEISEIDKIHIFRSEGRISEAFFMARKMAIEGDEDILEILDELMEEMNNV